jgi:hypothetical protein
MRRMMLVLLVFALAACGSQHTDQKTTSTPPGDAAPATRSPVIVELEQDYEALLGSQQAVSEIWDNLAANQEVQCGNYPVVLSVEAISAAGDPAYQPLADLLRSAASDLDRALAVWKAECGNPRRMPPPDVINEGRLAARAAGDALKEAEPLLAGLQ